MKINHKMMVNNLKQTDAALDSIFGKATSTTETNSAFRREAISALQDGNAETQTLTLRMAQNVYDCHPLPLTEERLMAALNSPNTKAKVELIRKGNEKLKSGLPCIFWQGTLDMPRYAEGVKLQLERSENLPSAINKDKYFTLATPFCFIDIDQPHEEDAEHFDPFVLFGKVQHHAPSGEVVFAQATARRGLRLVVKRNDVESLKQIQERYGEYAGRAADVLTDYTRRSFLTLMDDVYLMDVDAICKPFSRENAMKWAVLDEVNLVAQPSGTVIQNETENLDSIDIDTSETLSKATAQALDELLGGEVGEGSRHNRYMRILGYMRHLLPSVETLVEACGYDDLPLEERIRCAKDVLTTHPTPSTPKLLTEAIAIAQAKRQVQEAEESADVPARNDEPMLPQRLPKPLQVLTKKVHPLLYPCVIRSAFAAFATHLEGVRVRYENGTENELPIVHLCVAPQGSGKSSIIAPSDTILRSIISQDTENRLREAEWKHAKAMGETGIERPSDLCVQVLSSDCTSAAFNQKLADAMGKFLYMRMDELEGLRKMAGSIERATEILRLAFDASMYGQERVGAESVTTRCTLRLNLVASTTPITAQKFFKAATQDGTLTRIGLSTIHNPDKVRWRYGSYDERYHADLAPFIDRLRTASGLVVCTQAEKAIRELVEQMEDRLSVNGQEYLQDYVYRSGIIAFREALILFIMTGKWTKEIADYMAWSLEYQLWCMDKVFGRTIRLAHEAAMDAERTVPTVQNLLTAMTESFDVDALKRHFVSLGKKGASVSAYLRQQVHRGNLRRTADGGYMKTERFRQRYEG